MNKFSSFKQFALLGCMAAVIGACTQRLDRQTGIEGTGDAVASRGVVTKLGSIYVNGIHFETDGAAIYVGGELTTEDAIVQGMVVDVEGTAGDSANEATAHKVSFDYLATGEIEALQINENGMLVVKVLGYSALVPENTLFKGTDYDHLSIGDVISVSGLMIDDTTIYASQISYDPATDQTALLGRIKQIDNSANSFLINNVTIDYSQLELPNFNPNSLQEDLQIMVRGDWVGADRRLNAKSLKSIDPHTYQNQAAVTEEGFIYQYQSIEAFKLNGLTVDASAATLIGGKAADLVNQLRVSVRGVFRNNTLVANELLMILPSNFKTSGAVSQVDPINYTLTVEELTFRVNPFTVFDDKSMQANRYFNLTDLRVGDHVEIYAVKNQNGWSATTIKRQPQNGEPFSIKGEITGFDQQGNIYLHDVLVVIENIPPQKRWPYKIGNDVFVIGMIVNDDTIYAQEVIPAINGCSRWDLEQCRPEPDPMPPPYGGAYWGHPPEPITPYSSKDN